MSENIRKTIVKAKMSEYIRKPIVKILMLKGPEGKSIKEIKKTSTSGLVDTYTITMTDGTTSTFKVTNRNGNGISSISKTGTSGLVDTYTITMTDGTKSTFTVTNGAKGDIGEKGDTGPQGVKGQDGNSIKEIKKASTSGLTDTYEISLTDGTKRTFNVSNGKGIKSIAKTSTSGLTDTYTITYNDGTTSTFTVSNGKGIKSIEKTATNGLVDTHTITYTDGTTSTFTVTNGNGSGSGNENRNLIIKENLKNGWIDNKTGDNANSDTAYVNTDYIPLKSNEVFTVIWRKDGGVNRKWLGVYYYDSDKKIRSYDYKQVSGNPFIKKYLTSDQCAYLRIYWEGSKDENICIATDLTPSLEDSVKDILNKTYPVGSIYMSVNSTEPSTLFGGTWERLKGRFLIGAGAVADTNSNTRFGSLGAEKPDIASGETGGEYYHQLNATEMPEHNHDTNDWTIVANKNAVRISTNLGAKCLSTTESTNMVPNIKATKNEDGNRTGLAGGDGKHNNMPPYLAVFMWKRTA